MQKKFVWFLYDTIFKYTSRLELGVMEAKHSYWSVFRPMDYQNRHFSTHSLLDEIRYRAIRHRNAFLREMTEIRKLTYLPHKKNKYSVQMPHVPVLCEFNATSNHSALSIICRSLDVVKWPKSITGHIVSFFNNTEQEPYASGSNFQPSDLVKLQTMFTDICDYRCRVGSEILSNITGLHIPSNLHIRLERSKFPYGSQSFDAMRKSVPPIQYFYYKDDKYFEHFYYVYNLMKDCRSRLEKIQERQEGTSFMSKKVIIKIGIAGYIDEDNLALIPKRKKDISRDQRIWNASPIVFFQNDLSLKSASTILRQVRACHRILIRSDTVCDEDYEADDLNSITIVGKNKGQIRETIIACLEEPLHQMLQEWTDVLKSIISAKSLSEIATEMNAIRKHLLCCSQKDASTSFVLPRIGSQPLVPDDVKEYLFGMTDVTSFGIWGDSTLKVFVQKKTNVKKLKDELMKINKIFFKKIDFEIVKGKMVVKKTLKTGNQILRYQLDESGQQCVGTLGGFVTKTDDERKIYALTCNHIFPNLNDAAYTDLHCEEIGACVFTTREKFCDFAAIEIKESFVDKCDVVFRRDDKKGVNAKLYSENLSNLGLVYKIGAATDVTSGHILSCEYYDKLFEDNREIFLVRGIGTNFSAEGDSGSLVFARPRNVKQNHVDVVGMVYGCTITLYDEDEDSGEVFVVNDAHDRSEHISCCFRIHTALELFEENQGGEFKVGFKDNLSLTPSSSSESLSSDDLNEI